MEDAIVLNKSSVERGFAWGIIYKTQFINLKQIAGDKGLQKTLYFGRNKDDPKLEKFIGEDGLPYIGTLLNFGDPICRCVVALFIFSIVELCDDFVTFFKN